MKRRTQFHDHYYVDQGYLRIAGVDEAGRGPLAGPVVVACVMLGTAGDWSGLADSKLLPPRRRQELFEHILSHCESHAFALGGLKEIEKFNILGATKRAALHALTQLHPKPDLIITDALSLQFSDVLVVAEPKADQRYACVAAASILAKVWRDRLMWLYDSEYPGYGFGTHKGYGTLFHRQQLQRRGITTLHRVSFSPVRELRYSTQLTYSSIFHELLADINQASSEEELQLLRKQCRTLNLYLPPAELKHLQSAIRKRLNDHQ